MNEIQAGLTVCTVLVVPYIVQAIKTHGLDGVVVASCSPRMHEPTFRRTVERAGLNRYMFEMANIR